MVSHDSPSEVRPILWRVLVGSHPGHRKYFDILWLYIDKEGADYSTKDGQPLHYGDSFLLRPAATKDGEILYVHSKVGLLTTDIGKSGEPCLQLMTVKNVDTRWHCLFIDPKYRFETTGSPVLPNQKLIVCHSSSNRRLAVEHAYWFKTLFGMECEVSLHTILDAHRRETENNIWIIATQRYGENKIPSGGESGGAVIPLVENLADNLRILGFKLP